MNNKCKFYELYYVVPFNKQMELYDLLIGAGINFLTENNKKNKVKLKIFTKDHLALANLMLSSMREYKQISKEVYEGPRDS